MLRSGVVLFLLLAAIAPAGADPVRIMPLGDSITEAQTGHASYRYWLWHQLLDAGFDVDFVGNERGVTGGPPLYPDFDKDHEGHWGWWVDLVLPELAAWAAATQPDIVLVHLGSNDLFYYQGIQSTLDELGQVVDVLRTVNPQITVLLAQLIPSTSARLDDIPILNAGIPGVALAKTQPGSPVIVVDQFTGFDPLVDTYDGFHPDESGEQKMAARWFEALEPLLPGVTPVAWSDENAGERLLAAPSPNPFRRRTTLRFLLPGPQRVRLSIHDVHGALVAELVDRTLAGGVHSPTWTGRSDEGSQAPAGVYFVRLATATAAETRRIVLVP